MPLLMLLAEDRTYQPNFATLGSRGASSPYSAVSLVVLAGLVGSVVGSLGSPLPARAYVGGHGRSSPRAMVRASPLAALRLVKASRPTGVERGLRHSLCRVEERAWRKGSAAQQVGRRRYARRKMAIYNVLGSAIVDQDELYDNARELANLKDAVQEGAQDDSSMRRALYFPCHDGPMTPDADESAMNQSATNRCAGAGGRTPGTPRGGESRARLRSGFRRSAGGRFLPGSPARSTGRSTHRLPSSREVADAEYLP